MAFHSAACAAVGEMIYVAGGNNHFSYGGFGDQRLMEYGGSQDKLHNAVFRLDTSTGDWEVVSAAELWLTSKRFCIARAMPQMHGAFQV